MIHEKNHGPQALPTPTDEEIAEMAGTTELRAFVEEMEARAHRLRNPPWWDLLGRQAVWTLRLERALVDDDPAARRWLALTVPLRLLLSLGMLLTVALTADSLTVLDQVLGACVGALLAVWALMPWQRAQTYESGYRRAELESVKAPDLF